MTQRESARCLSLLCSKEERSGGGGQGRGTCWSPAEISCAAAGSSERAEVPLSEQSSSCVQGRIKDPTVGMIVNKDREGS